MLRVFTFSPAWGLPSSGPFALKLLKWLELAGVEFEQVVEDLPNKGPKGKNPWIEIDGQRIGDTEIIIDLLSRRTGYDVDAGLTAEQRALSHAVRRMVEEHFHMILEWELFVHPAGVAGARDIAARSLPSPLAGAAMAYMAGKFAKQLYARGIARHTPDIIASKARADLDAVEGLLGAKRFLVGDRLSMADIATYGMLYPMARWPMRTPAADDIKLRPGLIAYLERVHEARSERPAAAA